MIRVLTLWSVTGTNIEPPPPPAHAQMGKALQRRRHEYSEYVGGGIGKSPIK